MNNKPQSLQRNARMGYSESNEDYLAFRDASASSFVSKMLTIGRYE